MIQIWVLVLDFPTLVLPHYRIHGEKKVTFQYQMRTGMIYVNFSAPTYTGQEFGGSILLIFTTPKQNKIFDERDARCWSGFQEANHILISQSYILGVSSDKNFLGKHWSPLEFPTLLWGNVYFQAGKPDKYLFGILISACKKVLTGHWLLPEIPPQQTSG